MKILITGSDGFLAKNLKQHLTRDENIKLFLFDKQCSLNILEAYIKEVDFIFHLAGVNRPLTAEEFYEGNRDLTKTIIDLLEKNGKIIPILFSSSTQVLLKNDYGKSKLQAEELLLKYSKNNNIPVFIYRLPNIFGKWCKANYNSVIATWCYNICHNLEIKVDNKDTKLTLVYIDDVVKEFIDKLSYNGEKRYFELQTVYWQTLGEIQDLLYQFKNSRDTLLVPEVATGFKRALYATYLSYLATNNFSYELKGNKDERGTFYEILKTQNSGQFSLSTTAPNVERGGHFHHTKNEKFLVVKGTAIIQQRNILNKEIIEYKVSDEKMEIVEMIPGYTHNIKNIGKDELVLLLWANENFDRENPDTYFLKV